MNTLVLQTRPLPAPPPRDAYSAPISRRPAARPCACCAIPAWSFPVLIMPLALYALFAFVITGEAMDKDPKLGGVPVRRPSR